MIYSKWIPDRGGYAYYETSERRGLGDDLPVPQLRNTSGIGVASTDIGRAVPLGAKIVGYGQLAQGCVAPLDRTGLRGLGAAADMSRTLILAGLSVLGAVVGALVVRNMK